LLFVRSASPFFAHSLNGGPANEKWKSPVSKSTVLVIDDERVIVDTVVTILNNLGGFLAAGATTVDQAITLVRAICFDILLLDVVMPGTAGLEHAIKIRDECNTKVVLFSGHTATTDFLAEAHERGVAPFDVIAKPIHPKELARILQHAISS
jgi:CheY-like chemotaxis protein